MTFISWSFTKEDLLALVEESRIIKAEDGELSEDELESVAGGLAISLDFCFFIGAGAGFYTGLCLSFIGVVT